MRSNGEFYVGLPYVKLKLKEELSCCGKSNDLAPGWLSCHDNAIGGGGLGFDTRVGQTEHIVANGSPSLRGFVGAVLPQALSRGDGPRHSLHASA